MKLEIKQLTAWLVSSGLMMTSLGLTACAPQKDLQDTKGNVKVLVPSTSESGHSLKVVSLVGIENIKTLKGKYAEFYYAPNVREKTIAGKPTVTNFTENSSGILVPADEKTKQLATIYFHLQNLAQLDEELGAYGINQGPRKVGVGVRLRSGGKNNAFYDSQTDSILVVPYDQNNLPVAINPGILAHEHFHSLFYKVVRKNSEKTEQDKTASVSPETKLELTGRKDRLNSSNKAELPEEKINELYQALILRSLDEGLADYWGWMYTGDPDFIALSIPQHKANRSLKSSDVFSDSGLPMVQTIKDHITMFHTQGVSSKMNDYIVGFSYQVGTSVSRFLKTYTDLYSKERGMDSLQARKEVAKQIVNLLPVFKQYAKKENVREFKFSVLVTELAKLMGPLTSTECEFLAKSASHSQKSGENSFKCEQKNSQLIIAEVNEAADDSDK